MKKKWTSLLLAVCLTAGAALSGCGSTALAEEAAGSASGISAPTPTAGGTETSLYPAGTLRACMLEDGNRRTMDMTSTQTTRGYYELVHKGDNTSSAYLLTVTDFVTRQQAAVCTAAGCTHNSTDCPAYFAGEARLLEAGGKLVVIMIAQEVFGETDEETGEMVVEKVVPGGITVMDYDGGNKRVLRDSAQNMEQSWLTDDSFLYGVRQTPAPAGGDVNRDKTRQLFRISLETGEMEDLYQMDPMHCFPIGALEGKLLLRNIDAEEQYQLITIDPATGDAVTLENDRAGWSDGGTYWGNGNFYYSRAADEGQSDAGRTMYCLNLTTFEEEVVLEGTTNHGYSIWEIQDGRILYVDYEYAPTPGPDGSRETVGESYYWIDPATGETQELTLGIEHVSDWGSGPMTFKDPVIPLADAGDYYLVVSDMAGSSEEGWNLIQALILKTDYWANKPNYIPIAML